MIRVESERASEREREREWWKERSFINQGISAVQRTFSWPRLKRHLTLKAFETPAEIASTTS